MRLGRAKLPLDVTSEMRRVPVADLRSFEPLPAPIYLLLPSNEKFLALKGPLDFLLPSDLERLRSFEFVYYPSFVDTVEPYRQMARQLSSMLDALRVGRGWVAAPFEASDEFLRRTAPLWSDKGRVEAFFIAVLVTELCGPFAEELVVGARDQSQAGYEQAVLKSSWAVWQAMHLDYLDRDWLIRFRESVFRRCAFGGDPLRMGVSEDWIEGIVSSAVSELPISLSDLSMGSVRNKLLSRQERLLESLIGEGQWAPSVGLLDGTQGEAA